MRFEALICATFGLLALAWTLHPVLHELRGLMMLTQLVLG